MSLELLGLLLELPPEPLLLLLYAFYHVLIQGHEAPPCNYVIHACSRSSSSSSSSSSNSSPSSSKDIWQFCSKCSDRVEANDGNNTGNGKFAHLTPSSRT